MRRRDLFVGMLGLIVVTGCGSGTGAGGPDSEDRRRIAELLAEFELLPNKAKEFNASFVGTAPAARQKYAGNLYRMNGAPIITGDNATAKVAIQRINTGKWLGETTWEFTKVGDTWKVKSGPLP